jgi:hypothetical protein
MNQPVRTFKPLLALAAILLAMLACVTIPDMVRGTGEAVSVEVPVPDISEVVLATQGEMTIKLGDEEKLTIEAQENIQEYIQTRFLNGVLTIETTGDVNLNPTTQIRYELTVKSLEALAVYSSGSISAPALEAEKFRIDIDSSGDVNLESLIADTLEVTLNSSGDLEIAAGQVDTYHAENLRSQTAEVDINSSGSATVWVVDRLRATIQSSGDVKYYGAAEVNSAITSSGKVTHLGDK